MMSSLYIASGGVLPDTKEVEEILVLLILVFVGLSIVMFGVIMLYRSIKLSDLNYIASLRETYEEAFMEVAFAGGEELEASIEKVRGMNQAYLRNKRHARIVTNQLLFLYNSFSGESKRYLRELYLRAGFIDYSVKKVNSRHWELQAQGIREIASMKDDRVLGMLKQLSTKKNKLIAENAQIALLTLRGFDGLHFLSHVSTPISDWHQVNLFAVLKEYGRTDLPDFTVWLTSNEPTVLLFAVRLIRYFKQLDKSEKLFPLLEYSDVTLKTEAIRTLMELDKSEALPHLVRKYAQESVPVKTEIIRAYARLSEQDRTDVLVQWCMETEDPEIQKCCIEVLADWNATGALRELKINDEAMQTSVERLLHNKEQDHV